MKANLSIDNIEMMSFRHIQSVCKIFGLWAFGKVKNGKPTIEFKRKKWKN